MVKPIETHITDGNCRLSNFMQTQELETGFVEKTSKQIAEIDEN